MRSLTPARERRDLLAAYLRRGRPLPGPAATGSVDVDPVAALADVATFIDSHCVIDDAQGHGDGSGTMPFRLWPAQRTALAAIRASAKVVVLKARQLGLSWLCCADALHLCLSRSGQLVLLFSQGQDESNELLRRIEAMYGRLAPAFRAAAPALVRGNTSSLEWSNGSRIRSLPATQKAGRSFTASLAIMDEAAHMQWADKLYTALKPTVDGGGRLVVLSTANGVGNLFHRTWTRAVAGTNGFKTVFLPWTARPDRDQAWYDRQVAESADPEVVKQEYPLTSTEGFLASGRVRFRASWIAAQEPNLRDPLPESLFVGPHAPLRALDGLSVYELPRLGSPRPAVLGADVAEGLPHGDYSTAVVIATDLGREVLAELHGRWEPDEFGGMCHALAEAYRSMEVIERNNHGHATIAAARRLDPDRVAIGPDGSAGWPTNARTKPETIDLIAAALRDGRWVERSRAALGELQVYAVGRGGSTGAPAGLHDDRVMARAVALGWVAATPEPAEWGDVPLVAAGY